MTGSLSALRTYYANVERAIKNDDVAAYFESVESCTSRCVCSERHCSESFVLPFASAVPVEALEWWNLPNFNFAQFWCRMEHLLGKYFRSHSDKSNEVLHIGGFDVLPYDRQMKTVSLDEPISTGGTLLDKVSDTLADEEYDEDEDTTFDYTDITSLSDAALTPLFVSSLYSGLSAIFSDRIARNSFKRWISASAILSIDTRQSVIDLELPRYVSIDRPLTDVEVSLFKSELDKHVRS